MTAAEKPGTVATALTLTAALLGLPLVGVALTRRHVAQYLEFPPLTRYVEHAGFSWIAFVAMAIGILAVVLPFERHVWKHRRTVVLRPSEEVPFPWWGWAGLAMTLVTWIIAWTRIPAFASIQTFTFSPLWFGYILVANAWTLRRTGTCPMLARPRAFLMLFPVSAVFWWFFEYLNRFVQNWYYIGCEDLSPAAYVIYATLPFATVLPAVISTEALLRSNPCVGAGLDKGFPVNLPFPRAGAAAVLVASCFGLAGIAIWPDVLYPLLWVAPLLIVTSLQALKGRPTLFAGIRDGDWSRLYRFAAAALICGGFWEMWNIFSHAKWIYTVPFVGRFRIFEMPVLGFAGYLPFGLECAVIADGVYGWAERRPAGAAETARRDRSPHPVTATVVALVLAAACWLPLFHVFWKPHTEQFSNGSGISPLAQELATAQAHTWREQVAQQALRDRMRLTNAEWDFMGRTFHVLALANMILRDPDSKAERLSMMDAIIADTVAEEARHGVQHFLLDYARVGEFQQSGNRSLFLDGEIALMMGARRLVEEHPPYHSPFNRRIEAMQAYMRRGPVLCGESYPDECWTFCNTIALAAMRMSDALDGTDHRGFFDDWMAAARKHLVDPVTGMLISSFTVRGDPLDGPEGTSIFMSAHCLELIDPAFAHDQYQRARRELADSLFGFGYCREWPDSWQSLPDVDSGPIIPILDISAGASGLAILGAAAFGDSDYLQQLLTSLQFGGFPIDHGGGRRYAASNQVGDSVLLYALVQGPLWKEIMTR